VLQSVDTQDWLRKRRAIVRRALRGAKPGAIILMHDGGGNRSETLAALPAIIRGLHKRGFRVVSVPTLLRKDPPPLERLAPFSACHRPPIGSVRATSHRSSAKGSSAKQARAVRVESSVIATMSDGQYALLVTGGCFALGALVLLIQALQPARLRSWRVKRQVKRRVIAELERRQEEQLDRMRDTTGAGHNEAFVRYLELQNSIEIAKRTQEGQDAKPPPSAAA
jgi:hypothetical protein